MCGIAGLLQIEGDRPAELLRDEVTRMATTMAHRGPDDAGAWASPDGRVALAQRRLSIVDLSPLGHNPMPWDDGRLWITFNGEIYNFRELRRELEASGDRFRSQTDTEVILAAYDRWGLAAIDRFAGMFAFALWDAPRGRLWIARDRLGKKPLYYSEHGGTLRFASELKALVCHERFPRDVDPAAARLYLRYGCVPAPYTIYAAARKLPPGHYLTWQNGRAEIVRYWDPVRFAHEEPLGVDAALSGLESRLSLAVEQRRIADVPLGAFLSGGIDSSLVVALMQEQSATPVQTFTIRFEQAEFNEADHAAAVARHLGTDHYEETCGAQQLLDVIDALPDMFDEPFADSSAVPTFLVSRIARSRVTVALSGDGGDELFLGYPRHRFLQSARWALALPGPVRRSAASVAGHLPTRRLRRIADVLRSDDADAYARFVSWFSDDEVLALTGERAGESPFYADARARASSADPSSAGLLDLVSYLPDDILAKVDRTSMAVSLEVRAPLLDHRVVEFALGLPIGMKLRGGVSKWLLRELLYKRVPRELVDRPKMGFGVPLAEWFRGPLRARMTEYCRGAELEGLGLDLRRVRSLWDGFLAGQPCRADLVWQIFMLAAWARRFRTRAALATAH